MKNPNKIWMIKAPIEGLVTLLSGRSPFSTVVMITPVDGKPHQVHVQNCSNEFGEYDVLVKDGDWVNKGDNLVEVGKYYRELDEIGPTVEVDLRDLNIRKSQTTTCVEITHIPTGKIVGCFHKPTQEENYACCLEQVRGILAQEKWKEIYST